ncbi:hypothetical protein IIA79_08470, partial [bacterium]|nr:hypothetical protein [bacterium]
MSLRWSYCLAFALFGAMIPAAAAPALAEERLLAYEEAPFPVAVHRRLSVQWLPITHPQGLNFA